MDKIYELKEMIEKGKNIVFFGGAGVSTESGIPDFRGTGGLYSEKYEGLQPEEILHARYFLRDPEGFYRYYKNEMLHPSSRPNPAHFYLASLEREGKLKAVITQNIDGLHTLAGSRNVIELHGSVHRNYCQKCGRGYGLDKILTSGEQVPKCEKCKGIIKPDVVLYGEMLRTESIENAIKAVRNADVLIVGGTSLTVNPAASFVCDFMGEDLVIINKTPTPFDNYAKLVIREPIGKLFQKLGEI